MPTIVVSGHARKVGKTSVAAGLIAAFPHYSWTALKVSTHWHSESPLPDVCCIYEEQNREGGSDSSRFLIAGAQHSYWVRVQENSMAEALHQLQPILNTSSYLIIEGNNVLQYVHADFRIMVINNDVVEFKESAQRILYKADALIAIKQGPISPFWGETLRKSPAAIPLFETTDPQFLPPAFLDLVRSRLVPKAS